MEIDSHIFPNKTAKLACHCASRFSNVFTFASKALSASAQTFLATMNELGNGNRKFAVAVKGQRARAPRFLNASAKDTLSALSHENSAMGLVLRINAFEYLTGVSKPFYAIERCIVYLIFHMENTPTGQVVYIY